MDSTAGAVIAGRFGTLTLNADGSYSYAHTAGGGNETFTYTIRDSDGSLARATLTISLGDAAPGNFNIPVAGGAATTGVRSRPCGPRRRAGGFAQWRPSLPEHDADRHDHILLVEGRIRPQDIAFIRPQQNAVVKLSAYDSSVFGSLEGKVERISADTLADERPERGEKGETFYRVMVRTEKNHLGTGENPLPILPGMLATVEVLTGKKTVLDYLLKPARVLREEALRER